MLSNPRLVVHVARQNFILKVCLSFGFARLVRNHIGFFHNSVQVHETTLRLLSLECCVKGLRSDDTTSVVVERLLEDAVCFLGQEGIGINTSLNLLQINLAVIRHSKHSTIQSSSSSVKERKLFVSDSFGKILHRLSSDSWIRVEGVVDQLHFFSKLSVGQSFDNVEDLWIGFHVSTEIQFRSLSGFIKTMLSIGHLNL